MIINFLLWSCVGILIGWLAGALAAPGARRGGSVDIAVGVVGATLTGLIASLLWGAPGLAAGDLSLGSLPAALAGAAALLALAHLLRRRAAP